MYRRQGSRERLKVVGAEYQIPSICGDILEYSWVLMDFCGWKPVFLKKVWVQLHPLHPHLRDPCKLSTEMCIGLLDKLYGSDPMSGPLKYTSWRMYMYGPEP